MIENKIEKTLTDVLDLFCTNDGNLNLDSITKDNDNVKLKYKDNFYKEYLSKTIQCNYNFLRIISEYINKNLYKNKNKKQIIKDIKEQIDKEYIVTDNKMEQNKNKLILDKGNLNFQYKNILFKGVPGTGKSHKIDKIISDKLNLSDKPENILRVNIHSASSNADLMQGIAISTDNNQVSYKEKQGLIFKHIQKACFTPYQPFVLVLEEIQENSLNELIGDLIYLIEDSKRAKISKIDENLLDDKYCFEELIKFYINKLDEKQKQDKFNNKNIKLKAHFVEIPDLVSQSDKTKKLIMPDNFYIFCTSNYRDDKKVIEDNLLRRFSVIELYPDSTVIIDEDIRVFFEELNNAILETFEKDEIHPDRFLIGHANWINVKDKKSFYEALLKVVIDFKEIKEIDFESGIKDIFKEIKVGNENKVDGWFNEVKNKKNYKELVDELQKNIYNDILILK